MTINHAETPGECPQEYVSSFVYLVFHLTLVVDDALQVCMDVLNVFLSWKRLVMQ